VDKKRRGKSADLEEKHKKDKHKNLKRIKHKMGRITSERGCMKNKEFSEEKGVLLDSNEVGKGTEERN
jgi:hypothetical protein